MDEAERCHRVAYLAYGNLLAAGTAEELINTAGLTTWAVTGSNTHKLADSLKSLSGVEMVVPFGNTLHVCGRDAGLLDEQLQPFRSTGEYQWKEIATGLEEVFIRLDARAWGIKQCKQIVGLSSLSVASGPWSARSSCKCVAIE